MEFIVGPVNTYLTETWIWDEKAQDWLLVAGYEIKAVSQAEAQRKAPSTFRVLGRKLNVEGTI